MPSSDAQGTSWKEVSEELNRLNCLMAKYQGQFRSAGRGDIVEDLEWCRLLLMNAETAAINFVKKGSSLQLPVAWCQNAPNLFATKRFKIELIRGDMIVNRGGEITERKELGNPWPDNSMVLLVTGERTAELQDNPPASLVYMTGLEAVTFLEVIRAGYVHELTIFEPYLPDKGGYSCIYTRYGAGSRDAMSEHYVGVARPL